MDHVDIVLWCYVMYFGQKHQIQRIEFNNSSTLVLTIPKFCVICVLLILRREREGVSHTRPKQQYLDFQSVKRRREMTRRLESSHTHSE